MGSSIKRLLSLNFNRVCGRYHWNLSMTSHFVWNIMSFKSQLRLLIIMPQYSITLRQELVWIWLILSFWGWWYYCDLNFIRIHPRMKKNPTRESLTELYRLISVPSRITSSWDNLALALKSHVHCIECSMICVTRSVIMLKTEYYSHNPIEVK